MQGKHPLHVLVKIMNMLEKDGKGSSSELTDAALPALAVLYSRAFPSKALFEAGKAKANQGIETLHPWASRLSKPPRPKWGVPYALATGDTEHICRLAGRVEVARGGEEDEKKGPPPHTHKRNPPLLFSV